MRLLIVVIFKHGYNDNKVQHRLVCPRGTGGSRLRVENEFGKENYIWASGHSGPRRNHSRKAETLFIATTKVQGLLKGFHVWMIFGRIEMLKSRFMPLHGHEPRLSRGSAPLTTFPLAQPQIHVFFTKILYTNTGALLSILKYKFSL